MDFSRLYKDVSVQVQEMVIHDVSDAETALMALALDAGIDEITFDDLLSQVSVETFNAGFAAGVVFMRGFTDAAAAELKGVKR